MCSVQDKTLALGLIPSQGFCEKSNSPTVSYHFAHRDGTANMNVRFLAAAAIRFLQSRDGRCWVMGTRLLIETSQIM